MLFFWSLSCIESCGRLVGSISTRFRPYTSEWFRVMTKKLRRGRRRPSLAGVGVKARRRRAGRATTATTRHAGAGPEWPGPVPPFPKLGESRSARGARFVIAGADLPAHAGGARHNVESRFRSVDCHRRRAGRGGAVYCCVGIRPSTCVEHHAIDATMAWIDAVRTGQRRGGPSCWRPVRQWKNGR